MAAPTSKAGRDGDAQPGNKSLWLYRVACISMLIYIVATSNSNARMVVQQVHLATRASVSEAAALELCAAKGWVDPRAKQAAQPACPACPACECHCEAEACPQCPAAPDAAAVAAAKASANPPVTTFCPWSAHQSVFKGHDQMVSFGRNESVCADTIIYGYDMLFEYQKMWGQMFWMGVPFEQDPTDLQVIQEVLWDVRPDVLIELGTNTGGGALALASLMHLIEQSTKGKPEYKRMRIITIDPNDFHNPWFPGLSCTEEKPCKRPDTNPLWKEHVTFIQGLPTDTAVLDRVRALLKQWNAKTVMVSEDSSHAYHHVMPNLQAYKEFVTVGSYLLVQDTKTTRMGKHHLCSADGQTLAEFNKCYQEKKHGPLDAVHDFLAEEPAGIWENDKTREYMLYSQHADGWLKRLK
jgi:cephalosporin hydroxylase